MLLWEWVHYFSVEVLFIHFSYCPIVYVTLPLALYLYVLCFFLYLPSLYIYHIYYTRYSICDKYTVYEV